jgi:tetratricopeptide (TPR) repeat protein
LIRLGLCSGLCSGLDAVAVEQYRAALAIYPDTDQAALGIALALQRQGNSGEAIRWFDRSLAINPRLVLAHAYRCAAHIGAGNYVVAEAACRAGLRVEPTNSSLRKGLGFSLVGQADLERGNALLRRAQALDPEDAEIAAYFSGGQRELGAAPSEK